MLFTQRLISCLFLIQGVLSEEKGQRGTLGNNKTEMLDKSPKDKILQVPASNVQL